MGLQTSRKPTGPEPLANSWLNLRRLEGQEDRSWEKVAAAIGGLNDSSFDSNRSGPPHPKLDVKGQDLNNSRRAWTAADVSNLSSAHLKSADRKVLGVRVPLPAPGILATKPD